MVDKHYLHSETLTTTNYNKSMHWLTIPYAVGLVQCPMLSMLFLNVGDQ